MSIENLLQFAGEQQKQFHTDEETGKVSWFLAVGKQIKANDWDRWTLPEDNINVVSAYSYKNKEDYPCIGLNVATHSLLLRNLLGFGDKSIAFGDDYHIYLSLDPDKKLKTVTVQGKYSFAMERFAIKTLGLVPNEFLSNQISLFNWGFLYTKFPWIKIIGKPEIGEILSCVSGIDFIYYDRVEEISAFGGYSFMKPEDRYFGIKKISDYPEDLLAWNQLP